MGVGGCWVVCEDREDWTQDFFLLNFKSGLPLGAVETAKPAVM